LRTAAFLSKTFVLGEYAVLDSGRALLLAHDPAFESSFGDIQASIPFAQLSPAGKLAAKLGVDTHGIQFRDPHHGQGGFGGSGAEFLVVLAAAEKHLELSPAFAWHAWDLYRELTASGSGADILAQASTAQPAFVALEIKKRELRAYPPGQLGLELTLFHTGKKLPTHEHLSQHGEIPYRRLDHITAAGTQALTAGKRYDFLAAIREYGAELESLGLVAEHTRFALADLPETVLAAKGCGALGADVILVCGERGQAPALSPWAKRHSLVEVASLPI
jgi:hypothetical protein